MAPFTLTVHPLCPALPALSCVHPPPALQVADCLGRATPTYVRLSYLVASGKVRQGQEQGKGGDMGIA